MATYEEVRNAVIEVLTDIQINNGQPVDEITDATCPTSDLPGFDSIHCVEASVILSVVLGYDINENLFLPQPPSTPPLSVHDITEQILKDMARKERREYERHRFSKENHC